MKPSHTKTILGFNIIFLVLGIIFLSNAYLSGVDIFTGSEEKIEQIKSIITNESNIEKLREISLLSIEAKTSSYELVKSAMEVLKATASIFCFVIFCNIFYLTASLKKKSNKLINRTENTSAQN